MKEYKLKVSEQDSGKRLDAYILESCRKHELEFSRTHIQKLIRQGYVAINEKKLTPNYKVKTGELINLSLEEKKPFPIKAEKIPLDIVYEDDDVIVVNKPIGLVVHPAAGNLEHTLVQALLFHSSRLSDVNPERPGIVHRLDKDTSGLLLVARTNDAHQKLVKQFSKHTVKRRYVALVKGRVEFDEGSIDLPIGRHRINREKMSVSFLPEAKDAVTHYRTLKRGRDYSLLELTPYTGRTHQLRVHLASLGHPICGDKKYGKTDTFKRLMLHARYIGFIHPKSKKFLEFSTDIPQEFSQLFK
ncbi:MAG: RluA family pseudouridine synthase [Candidatus Omnitrophica bacterium]|nr:RluA family pseudouridine synthase [Candidatus Omnitrophota bacterium]MDD5610042.1 RluA family pseudouridine synthase [Candidatus Omnitrophota bacterium]